MNTFYVVRTCLLSTFFALAASAPMSAIAADEGHSQDAGRHDPSAMNSMPMAGDPDHDFASMMRKHHSDGVAMAEKEMKDGRDPQMKEMAGKIITAQKKEIEELDSWLAKHKPAPAAGDKK